SHTAIVGHSERCDTVVRQSLAADGVDPNHKDTKYGRAPLWRAMGKEHDTVVALLLAKDGIDSAFKDSEYGQTPLSVAPGNGHKAVINLLLANDEDGWWILVYSYPLAWND
ncbi:hypothetical protein K469DRAFT_585117, partial [Zopfia rhizophila CBS 207.26]